MSDYPLKDLPFKHVARTVKFNESANQSLDDKYRIINERENAVELFLSDSDVADSLKPYIKVVENEKLHDAGHKEIALTTMLTVVDKEGIKDLLHHLFPSAKKITFDYYYEPYSGIDIVIDVQETPEDPKLIVEYRNGNTETYDL